MITFVLPTHYEAEDLLKSIQKLVRKDIAGVECYQGQLNNSDVHVIICGMGLTLSKKSTEAVFAVEQPSLVIMAGFAGALSSQLRRGQIVIAAEYSSSELINFIKLIPNFDICRLHSASKVIATVEEKKKLAESTRCQMVDMEMSAVHSVALKYGAEILGIRAITDLAHEPVPIDLLSKGYNEKTGKTTPLKMAFFLLLRPQRIKELKNFLRPLPTIRKNLTDFIITAAAEFE